MLWSLQWFFPPQRSPGYNNPPGVAVSGHHIHCTASAVHNEVLHPAGKMPTPFGSCFLLTPSHAHDARPLHSRWCDTSNHRKRWLPISQPWSSKLVHCFCFAEDNISNPFNPLHNPFSAICCRIIVNIPSPRALELRKVYMDFTYGSIDLRPQPLTILV